MFARSTVASLVLLLAGCAGVAVPVRPALPDLPASARAGCPLSPAKPGDDARVDAAKAYAAYGCEKGKRTGIITFYDNLRSGLK